MRAALAVRDALVRTRTRYAALIKAAVRHESLRLTPSPSEGRLAARARDSAPARLLQTMPMIGPVTALGTPLHRSCKGIR